MKQLYVLVEWVKPENPKTNTPGIPIEWVKDYDVQKYEQTGLVDSEESHLIEWRDTSIKKKHERGWPVYNGVIKAISTSRTKLDKLINTKYDGAKSPEFVKPVMNKETTSEESTSVKRVLEYDEDLSVLEISKENAEQSKRKKKKKPRKISCEIEEAENNENVYPEKIYK
ncbi:hypothetical protein HCN44_008829 [Aphidius gifuensis]|uniref:Uncharacterized protein n=1 Tax=Aphidius gifuensis TaxID=684658 RepID=A0A834Y404_APHGI|nr:hypothetical protein HCN44_008829 [Aphidius gifuensis]